MADGYTPTTERVRDLFTWAYAWRTSDDIDGADTDLSGLRAANHSEFDRWLTEHDARVRDEERERIVKIVDSQRPEMGMHINVSEYRRGKDDALILAARAIAEARA